jgi:hypothetical protein
MGMAEWQREQRETFGAGNLDFIGMASLFS